MHTTELTVLSAALVKSVSTPGALLIVINSGLDPLDSDAFEYTIPAAGMMTAMAAAATRYFAFIAVNGWLFQLILIAIWFCCLFLLFTLIPFDIRYNGYSLLKQQNSCQ